MLGAIKLLGVNAASQQTLFVVSGSTSIHCYREVTQVLAVIKVLGVGAALQQTLVIVSGSQSIQC